jgi:hypothetical protein
LWTIERLQAPQSHDDIAFCAGSGCESGMIFFECNRRGVAIAVGF